MSTNNQKTLLHICCAPCATYPTKFFNENGYLYDGYFYNPNIHPESEFQKRLEYVKKLSEIRNFNLIVDEGYDESSWVEYEMVPRRCQKCYNMRLKKAFEYASKHDYQAVTSTLLISPYQQHELIVEIANNFSKHYHIKFDYIDFRPYFREGQNEAKELNFYRQKYCGCLSSLEDKLTFDIDKEERKGANKNG
ncbi:MAG: epoxyqueuosine reductase QueH [Acholeplasmataceae bacterium]|jgi:predicted adenine nucleotide alpha hydrolase (AANH) superfamily ATPase